MYNDNFFKILEIEENIYHWWKDEQIKNLYRYYTINENTLNIFRKNELFFPVHTMFNDPFDFSVGFNNSEEDYKRIFGNSELAALLTEKTNY